ncbi:MAG: Flp pilus assembly protein CpaB [Candidatus Sulfotelmatobacter sp.]
MNRRRLLFIATAALAVGSLVSLKVYRMLRAQSGPVRVFVDVVVAARDIPVGAKIVDRDLMVVQLPPEDLAADVFHAKGRAVGRGVVLPIGKGDLVLPYKLAAEDGGSVLSSMIPSGMRAVTVDVNEVTGVAGFAAPGSRVDVLATLNLSGSKEPRTLTILQNMKVLATDQNLDHGTGGLAHVVTLLVLPEDAEKLALARQEGHIQLILRNPVDMTEETPRSVGNKNLFGGGIEATPRVTRGKRAAQPLPELPKCDEIEILNGSQRETIKVKSEIPCRA